MRDEVKGFKKELVLDAVAQLFYERGFAGTTVEAVASRLKVTKPFIYSYFKDKNELLVALYERGTVRLTHGLDRILEADGPPVIQFAELMEEFARVNMEYQTVATIFLQEEKHLSKAALKKYRAQQKAFDVKLAKLIQRGVDAGEFTVDDPMIASLAVSGMIRWIQRWYKADGRLPVSEISRMMTNMALRSLKSGPAVEMQPAKTKAKRKASVNS